MHMRIIPLRLNARSERVSGLGHDFKGKGNGVIASDHTGAINTREATPNRTVVHPAAGSVPGCSRDIQLPDHVLSRPMRE